MSVQSNYTLERTVAHRGRPVLAMELRARQGARAAVAGRSVKR